MNKLVNQAQRGRLHAENIAVTIVCSKRRMRVPGYAGNRVEFVAAYTVKGNGNVRGGRLRNDRRAGGALLEIGDGLIEVRDVGGSGVNEIEVRRGKSRHDESL